MIYLFILAVIFCTVQFYISQDVGIPVDAPIQVLTETEKGCIILQKCYKKRMGGRPVEKNNYDGQSLAMLKQEIAELEHQNMDAIQALEIHLDDLQSIELSEEDKLWCSRLDTIEIFTMQEIPSLKESIRRV
jgi:hypothetical protein